MKKTKNIFYRKKIPFGFFNDYSGSIAVPFAIMLPTILLSMTAGVNNSQILKERIALSEATNEASLAIIAMNNANINDQAIKENREIAQSYINYYLKNKINPRTDETNSELNIIYNGESKPGDNYQLHEYYVTYNHEVEPLIKLNTLGKLGSSIRVSNNQSGYGNTRKQLLSIEKSHIAFITDFSGSSTCLESDSECNEYNEIMEDTSSTKPKNRINAAMSAIKEIVDKYSGPEFLYSLIPYDIGVPMLNGKKNILRGDSYSCSVPYKLQTPFKDIDFEFWSNKNIFFTKWQNLKNVGTINNYLSFNYFDGKYSNSVFYYLDYFNYKYYAKIFGPANSLFSDYDLEKKGYCVKNYYTPGAVSFSKYRYSCGLDQNDYPLASTNRSKVKQQYASMVQLYDYMYSNNSKYNTHFSLANTKTIDIDGTIESLLQKNYKPIAFTRPIVPSTSDFTPFQAMCSSPLYSNQIMFAGQSKMHESVLFDSTYWKVSLFKNEKGPYLVDLTSASKMSDILNRASRWVPGGGTDTMSGFLTAIPILVRGGKAENKLFIVLSDGKDDSGADQLTTTFLKDKEVCKTVSEFFREDMGVRRVDYHYIRLLPKHDKKSVFDLSSDEIKKEFGPWVDCVKMSYKTTDDGRTIFAGDSSDGFKSYIHFATDKSNLIQIARDLIEAETGNFIVR